MMRPGLIPIPRPAATRIKFEIASGAEVLYWRDRNREVAYVVADRSLVAIEVASGRRKEALPGLEAFAARYPELFERTFLLRHYTKPRLECPQARRTFLLPDLPCR